GCFVEKDWKRYVQLVCVGHEIIRSAAQLADEAREIEKTLDSLTRKPHDDEGLTLLKRRLMEKPQPPQ
ncbi:MAG: F420-dependent methylenetetrahydromethanopterin dehydrogenase, partial [Candidatus Bathyarchaeia archaeon]